MNRDEMKEWLDRKPPPAVDGVSVSHWSYWYEWKDGHIIGYLGEVSARTGPDKVKTDQRCTCEVCVNGKD